MKILKITLFLTIISCFTFSCGSDSDSNDEGDKELADQQNELEDVPVALEDLDSGIFIEGATKNNGVPPQPNSNLNLAVSSNNVEAVQKAGFNLKFSTSEAAVAGAYLQFQDASNTSASNYFDIPVSNFIQSKIVKTKSGNVSKTGVFSKNLNTLEGEYEIDIDFDDSFPPGNFCGVLCIYDSANNISQPISVCVVVESWGGNASLVAKWRVIDIDEGDDIAEVNCSNGGVLNVSYEENVKDDIVITFDANGNFELLEDYEANELNWEASSQSCSAVYYNEVENYSSRDTGKWAYNEDGNTLTIVSFVYEDFTEPQYSEDYPNGDLLLDNAKVEFVGGKLKVTDSYSENGQTYSETYTFEKI